MSVDFFFNSISLFFPYITLKHLPLLSGVKSIFNIHTKVKKERSCGRIVSFNC